MTATEPRAIREITVYAYGDSADPSVWSNVPYCLTSELERAGVRVNRVDLRPSRAVEAVFDGALRAAAKARGTKSLYSYSRTPAHHRRARLRIRSAVAAFPKTDAHLFLTFGDTAQGLTTAPVVNLGDWTYAYAFENFYGRAPGRAARRAIEREDDIVRRSDLCVTFFPSVAAYLRGRLPRAPLRDLPIGANSLREPDPASILAAKRESRSLLFIGGPKYREGLSTLLEATVRLRAESPEWSLDVVGLSDGDVGRVPPGVRCHGYLDKGTAAGRDRYYDLLTSARLIVNTTPKWASFSAILEAMYHYTPVIITRNPEFEGWFGPELSFGRYCSPADADALTRAIVSMPSGSAYLDLCTAARAAAAPHTWSAFAESLLDLVDPLVRARRR